MATLSDEIASLSAQMQKLTCAVSNLVLARSLQGTVDLRALPKNCLVSLKLDHLVKDEHQLFDENPAPNSCCNPYNDGETTSAKPLVSTSLSEIDDSGSMNEELQPGIHEIAKQIGCNYAVDKQESVAYNNGAQLPLAHNVIDEMPLPDFIRKMAQSSTMKSDKTGEFDHEQLIRHHSAEDEQRTNACHMFDKMPEPENESIPAMTTVEHEKTVMPTMIEVITKPYLQFAEIDNRFLSSDKIFGNLAWEARLKNTTSFEDNYELLSADCVKTEVFRHDSDASIPKKPVRFQSFDLSRLISFVNFSMYALQVPLLSATLVLKQIIFDPGGYFCSLIVPSALDDGHKLICLFTYTIYSMYYINAFLVTNDISKLLDWIHSITLEDKGVFKGKEDKVHKRPSCRLLYTMILQTTINSSGTKKKSLSLNHAFGICSLHCHCSVWNDHPHCFWLSLVMSLAWCLCQGRCDIDNNVSLFKESTPFSMVQFMNSDTCNNISLKLTMGLYHSKVDLTRDALVYVLSIVNLSSDNVEEVRENFFDYLKTYEVLIKFVLIYLEYESSQQGLVIGEFECGKGCGRLVMNAASPTLFITGTCFYEVLMFSGLKDKCDFEEVGNDSVGRLMVLSGIDRRIVTCIGISTNDLIASQWSEGNSYCVQVSVLVNVWLITYKTRMTSLILVWMKGDFVGEGMMQIQYTWDSKSDAMNFVWHNCYNCKAPRQFYCVKMIYFEYAMFHLLELMIDKSHTYIYIHGLEFFWLNSQDITDASHMKADLLSYNLYKSNDWMLILEALLHTGICHLVGKKQWAASIWVF